MGLAAEAGEVNTEAVVVTFDGEGVGLALPVAVPGEDQPVGVCQKSVQKVMCVP